MGHTIGAGAGVAGAAERPGSGREPDTMDFSSRSAVVLPFLSPHLVRRVSPGQGGAGGALRPAPPLSAPLRPADGTDAPRTTTASSSVSLSARVPSWSRTVPREDRSSPPASRTHLLSAAEADRPTITGRHNRHHISPMQSEYCVRGVHLCFAGDVVV